MTSGMAPFPGSQEPFRWVQEPVYKSEVRTFYQVVSLLIVDGKLIMARAQQEEDVTMGP